VKANPEHAEAFYQLGVAHYELSQINEAIKAFDQAIQLKGGHGDASLLKGRALLVKRDYNEAQRSFHQSIRIKPQLIEPYQALSMLYRKFHQAAPAAQVLKNAIENHPDVYEFHRDLGQIYAGQDQYSKAIPLYETALKLNPSASTLMFLLARAYMESKDYRRAEVHLKTFMKRGVSAENRLEHKAAKQMLLEIKKR
jgi:cytochrome c-type biogenesis protein CcmH/NrfG